MLTPSLIFITSASTTYLLSLLSERVAPYFGLTDVGEKRKRDMQDTPLGGISLFFGIFIGLISFHDFSGPILPLLLGGAIITLMGLIDDFKNLTPKTKLAVQSIGALIPVLWGIKILSVDFEIVNLNLAGWSILITLLWMVGVTNALNLIDGLDGLCVGGCIITSSFIAFFSWMSGNRDGFLLSLALVGASLAFLRFNFHPAKLFLGDSGSYFIGFMLSILTLGYHSEGFFKITQLPLIVSIAVLALPLADTLWAIIRRTSERKSILKADEKHIHHRLLIRIGGYKKTVLILYLIWFLFCLLGTIAYLN